ncbi:MAG: signal peptidase II [Myxococcales bacterium]|nr:signal peptidase II [Myxococcales bacterium]
MNYKKILLIFVTFVGFLVLDQWSKMWAERSLGTPEHPLFVRIDNEFHGRTVSEVLKQTYPDVVTAPNSDNLARTTLVLDTAVDLGANTPVYGDGAPPASGFYAFSRSEDLPPRRVFRSDQFLMERWIRAAIPNVDLPTIRQAVLQTLSDVTLATFLSSRIPYLNDESAIPIADSHTYIFQQTKQRPTPSTTLQAGDILLVTDRKIPVIDGFLQFSYAENPGAAWGFMASAPERFRHIFFICISLLATIALSGILFNLDKSQTLLLVAFSSILSGAIGNFIDRIRFHYVIDFIDMYIGDSHWPTYNVADIAISVGVVLLLGELLFKKDSALFGPPKSTQDEPSKRGT